MHPGDAIHYTLFEGSKDPREWSRGVCVVIEVPSVRVEPLILGGLIEYPQPTPWTGDKKEKAA